MEPVKDHQGMKIIGIDNGYGNIKTANCCFPAGLTAHDAEPVFKDDLLVYDGRYYLIGTGHKEFKADKTGDDDYYILTLAAIARELNVYGLTDATVYLKCSPSQGQNHLTHCGSMPAGYSPVEMYS